MNRTLIQLGQERRCWLAPQGCPNCRDREGGLEFRRGMMLVVSVPGGDADFECPYGVPWGVVSADAPAGLAARAEDDTERFRALWAEFHRWTLSFSGAPAAGLQWISSLLSRLPCGQCRNHGTGYVRDHPPDFTSPATLFAWGVGWHNDVSARLGKPQLHVDEARALFLASRESGVLEEDQKHG